MQCLPHLKAFVKDEYLPTAILLEYIPNMKELHRTNYNEKTMRNFVDGLNVIHEALMEHGDVHPRNMMIVEGEPERAIWIDFDRAQTFNGELTERQEEWIAFEKALMAEMADFIVCVRCFLHGYALLANLVGYWNFRNTTSPRGSSIKHVNTIGDVSSPGRRSLAGLDVLVSLANCLSLESYGMTKKDGLICWGCFL